MADEIKVTLAINYENGLIRDDFAPSTINLPQATQGVNTQTISHTTAEADVSIGTVGTPGYCVLRNLTATTSDGATLHWGLKSSTGGIPQYFRLPPRGVSMVCYGTSGMVIRAKAASGTLKSLVKIYES